MKKESFFFTGKLQTVNRVVVVGRKIRKRLEILLAFIWPCSEKRLALHVGTSVLRRN